MRKYGLDAGCSLIYSVSIIFHKKTYFKVSPIRVRFGCDHTLFPSLKLFIFYEVPYIGTVFKHELGEEDVRQSL